jgi:hypothetical protein
MTIDKTADTKSSFKLSHSISKLFVLNITDQLNSFQPNAPVEEENEQLTDGLKDKIGALRTVN